MKLIAYTLTSGPAPEIRPAPATRAWMDETPHSYAYRCLPLNTANAHGWEILCPVDFRATWDGNVATNSIKIEAAGNPYHHPISHFGSGVLTFHVNVLFRTEDGQNLYVTGPANFFKDGIVPLQGVIETDWSPYTFTMNWKFTRPCTIEFKKGEPFCFFFPLNRSAIEQTEPEFRAIDSDPETKKQFEEWNKSRDQFLKDLHDPSSQARADKWQKLYYRGLKPDETEGCPAHQIKLRVKSFK
jgi:hypothetical protein